MLHFKIIVLILLTFPTADNTLFCSSPTLCPSTNPSHSSTHNFYRFGHSNWGTLHVLK